MRQLEDRRWKTDRWRTDGWRTDGWREILTWAMRQREDAVGGCREKRRKRCEEEVGKEVKE